MKLRLTCREVTQLMLAGEDRRLGTLERLRLRAHLIACTACPRFADQVRFMRSALGRWRRYTADGPEGETPR